MNTTNEQFLSVLRAALRGKPAQQDLSPDQWNALFRLAELHSLLPMVVEAAWPAAAGRLEGQPWAAGVRKRALLQVAMQTMRTAGFLDLHRALREAGVRPLVVKGILCRSLYPQPDQRQSSDEDLLIPPDRFDACHQVLTGFGLQPVSENRPESFEVSYRMAGSPLHIELHKQLFPPQSSAYAELNRFFDGAYDRAVTEVIQGEPIFTLECTDHLLYLILHAFKHFLHSGFGIRQVCDIILYANRYGSRIDWEALLECCTAVRAGQFAAAIFQIGSRWLVFDPDTAAYPASWRAIRVEETALLEDILHAGVYGGSDRSRRHSSAITLDAVAAQKQHRKARSAALVSVFPPARTLERRYPWLTKHPWLLPAAWGSRLLTYLGETRRTDSSAADALKIGAERLELLRHYGILN